MLFLFVINVENSFFYIVSFEYPNQNENIWNTTIYAIFTQQ